MRRILRFLFIVCVVLVLAGTVAVYFSPYEYKKESGTFLLSNTIDINAPPSRVYEYLGNSAHAADWSEFVDHIVPLNPDKVADGQVGSLRRCFKNADEHGLQWDEEIVKNELNRCRRLTIFNMKAFPLSAEGLATEQVYEETNGATRLTFTLFFLKPPGLIDRIKMHLGALYVQSVFQANMNNIKKIIESDGKV